MFVGIWETELIAAPHDGQKRPASWISAEQAGQRITFFRSYRTASPSSPAPPKSGRPAVAVR